MESLTRPSPNSSRNPPRTALESCRVPSSNPPSRRSLTNSPPPPQPLLPHPRPSRRPSPPPRTALRHSKLNKPSRALSPPPRTPSPASLPSSNPPLSPLAFPPPSSSNSSPPRERSISKRRRCSRWLALSKSSQSMSRRRLGRGCLRLGWRAGRGGACRRGGRPFALFKVRRFVPFLLLIIACVG